MAYFYLDNLNSRRVVIDSSGTVLDRMRYSAWGVATMDVGSDDIRSFTGKDYNASGLIYSNARYYDPATGRFLTEDPSRKGANWYAYCENDPINKTDSTGMDVGDKARYDYVQYPTQGVLTSVFGPRPPERTIVAGQVHMTPEFHTGIDIANVQGTAVVAARGGVVSFAATLRDTATMLKLVMAGGYPRSMVILYHHRH